MAKAFLNGKILPLAEMKVSVFDRGFLYGDGVFESLRTYRRRPFLLEEHLKRLLTGAKQIKIRVPYSPGRLKAAVMKTIAANPFKECYLKIIITRGKAKSHGLDFSNSGKPTVIILAEELKEYPQKLFEAGWKAVIASIPRTEIPTSRLKSLCYLDNALAKEEARRQGAGEALMLDEKGRAAEGTVSNFFIVKLGTIYTPPMAEPILAGITRNLVMKLAKQSAIPLEEKIILPKELYNCDECFITLSGAGIIPITKIWNRKIGGGKCGPVTRQLIALYQSETERQN